MKILLISDTHGQLDWIEKRVEQTKPDFVIHAGDFGFYDRESVDRLSNKELSLRIKHSSLPKEIRRQAFKYSRDDKVSLIEERCPLSQLPEYLARLKEFSVPVYAVWGNHEDKVVVEHFQTGSYGVRNLHLIEESITISRGRFRIFGLGGNFIKDERLFEEDLGGNSGKVWSTLEQYARLYEQVKLLPEANEIRIFVTHVSPGKELLLERFAAHLNCHFYISGHMGTPYPMLWNAFATAEIPEARERAQKKAEELAALWQEHRSLCNDDGRRGRIDSMIELLQREPSKMRSQRGNDEPWWYRGMFCLNLPDAPVGYMVLEDKNDRVSFQSHSEGQAFPSDRNFY